MVLVGREYWECLIKWIKDNVLANDYIEPQDLKIFHLVDNIDEVVPIIQKFYKNHNSQKYRTKKHGE